jgi:chemotaxis protein methyltransferase CheR
MTLELANTPLPNDNEFRLFQQLIETKLGIFLPEQKKALLSNRLWKRLQACDVSDYAAYYRFIQSPQGREELSTAAERVSRSAVSARLHT